MPENERKYVPPKKLPVPSARQILDAAPQPSFERHIDPKPIPYQEIPVLTKAWNWLNGQKTVLGLVLAVLTGEASVPDLLGPEVTGVIDTISKLLIGIGVLHKIGKANTLPGPTA